MELRPYQKECLGAISQAYGEQYKGKDYFDIRLYYQEKGEWRPSKKGLCLSIGLVPELKDAIRALDKAITR